MHLDLETGQIKDCHQAYYAAIGIWLVAMLLTNWQSRAGLAFSTETRKPIPLDGNKNGENTGMRIQDIPEIDRLSTSEKILLVEDLWDQIASQPSEIPIPPSHINELERRLHRHTTHPGTLLSLEELQSRIDPRK